MEAGPPLLSAHTAVGWQEQRHDKQGHDLLPLGPATSPLQAHVAALTDELAGVERDMLEAEAKHEQLKLLEVRTR